MMLIAITGVPGTGKTTIANELKNQSKTLGNNFTFVDVTKEIKENKLYTDFDEQDQTLNVDMVKFDRYFSDLIKALKSKNNGADTAYVNNSSAIVFEGHMSHLIEGLDFVIYLISDIEVISDRLKARNYSNKKIQDNTESQIMNVIEDEIKSMNYKFAIVDTSKNTISQSIEEIKGFFAFIGINSLN